MRPTSRNSDLDKKIFTYALVAGAGLAASQPALSAPIQSVGNPVLGTHVFDSNDSLPVDLNQDGTTDLVFQSSINASAIYLYAYGNGLKNASPSTTAGPSAYFESTKDIASVVPPSLTSGLGQEFLAVRFTAGATPSTYYGFLRMSLSGDLDSTQSSITLNLQDIWYESTPDTAIHVTDAQVPEPGSLGLLALGAVGLGLWRRRNRA